MWNYDNKLLKKRKKKNDEDDSDDEDDNGGTVKTVGNRLYFYGDVNSKNILELNKQINFFNDEIKKYDVIYLHIQSYGGLVHEALSLVDTITYSDIPIHCIIEGIAASAATIISIVCDHRYIRPNSVMMIHQLRGGVYGRKSDVDDEYKNLNKLNNKILKIFKEYSRLPKKELEKLFSRELEYSPSECLKYGFVDEIMCYQNKKRKR